MQLSFLVPHHHRGLTIRTFAAPTLWRAPVRLQAASTAARDGDVRPAIAELSDKLTRGLRQRPPDFPAGPSGDITLQLVRDPLGFFERASAEYGGSVGMVMAGEYIVVVSEPALARNILITDAKSFPKQGSAFFPSLQDASALGTTDGAEWKRRRQIAAPAFRAKAIGEYWDRMASSTESWLAGAWSDGRGRNMWEDYFRLVTDLMVGSLTGATISMTQSQQIMKALDTYTSSVGVRSWLSNLLPEWLPDPIGTQALDARRTLDSFFEGIIGNRRRLMAQSSTQAVPKDFLQSLLEAQVGESGSGLTDKDVRDELIGMLIGQEPVASGLAWASVYMTTKPWVQRAARAEVDSVLKGRPPTLEDTKQLRYLSAVLLEVMRLHPPTALFPRYANATTTFQGVTIPEGTTVILAPYVLHRSPKYWRDPLRFYPERWSDWLSAANGNVMSLLADMGPNGAFMPFSIGSRTCIAAQLSVSVMTQVLAIVLQKYELAPPPPWGPAQPTSGYALTHKPVDFDVRVTRRAV